MIHLEVMVIQLFLHLTNLNANNDTITLLLMIMYETKCNKYIRNTVFTLSGTTLTFTDAPADDAIIYLQG